MIYAPAILGAILLYMVGMSFLPAAPSTVRKGHHFAQWQDWLLLKGGWFPWRNAKPWGDIPYTFTVTQAMVDADSWTGLSSDGDTCFGDSSKIIGRTVGLRGPTKGSIRVNYRTLIDSHGQLSGDTVEFLAMGHDPAQGGKKIWASLGMAKVGEEVVIKMAPQATGSGTFFECWTPDALRIATLPIKSRFGFPLGHYQGGDCPALTDVTL